MRRRRLSSATVAEPPRRDLLLHPFRVMIGGAGLVDDGSLVGSGWEADTKDFDGMPPLKDVFRLDPKGLDLKRGVAAALILALTRVVLDQFDDQRYFLSVVFAVLFTALSDPGGDYRRRVRGMAAALTVLAFYVGTQAWGWVVLAVFVVTVLAGLALRFGLQKFAAAGLLNVWFIVAIAVAAGFFNALPVGLAGLASSHEWKQGLSWLIGSAVWIALTCVVWLAGGRRWRPAAVIEMTDDEGPRRPERTRLPGPRRSRRLRSHHCANRSVTPPSHPHPRARVRTVKKDPDEEPIAT